jgi:hypothetical protein
MGVSMQTTNKNTGLEIPNIGYAAFTLSRKGGVVG